MNNKRKILIIDNDKATLKSIAYTFQKDYDLKISYTGREALELLKTYKPDIIILEIVLPDINGFQICKLLKQHPVTVSIPVIILSTKKDLNSRLKGLKLGIIDYLTKPFNLSELKMRIQNIFNQHDMLSKSGNKVMRNENKMITVLKYIQKIEEQTIIPQPDPKRQLGYGYPGLDKVLNSSTRFVDINFLEHIIEQKGLPRSIYDDNKALLYLENLTERKALSAKVHDVIHLCPYCDHHDINFREVCPNCKSVDINMIDMVHHFRCAYVGPEEEFRQGMEYKCPKCGQLLRHIGVDYEKPARSYMCAKCHHIFHEPSVSCMSMNCGKIFDVDNATVKTVYSYMLTEVGQLAIEKGHIEEATFEYAFWDLDLELYTIPFLHEQVKLEIRRSARYKRPFCLMLIQFSNMKDLKEKYGRVELLNILKELGRIINEGTRTSDIPARNSESELLFLLPETSAQDAEMVTNRIRENTQVFNDKILLNIVLVEYPRSGLTFEELLSGLSKGISQAYNTGSKKTIFFLKDS